MEIIWGIFFCLCVVAIPIVSGYIKTTKSPPYMRNPPAPPRKDDLNKNVSAFICSEFEPPFRVGKKQGRAVLDSRGHEVVIFKTGMEVMAENYCEFLNSAIIYKYRSNSHYRNRVTGVSGVFVDQYMATGKGNTILIRTSQGQLYYGPAHEFEQI